MNKNEYISNLWKHKSVSEIILVMYSLIENTDWDVSEKKKSYAVMKGIIAYTDRGDSLLEHHRKYLQAEWDVSWNDQVDGSVKDEIKEWLLEPPF
jgi:tryptophanase